MKVSRNNRNNRYDCLVPNLYLLSLLDNVPAQAWIETAPLNNITDHSRGLQNVSGTSVVVSVRVRTRILMFSILASVKISTGCLPLG
jgi:hypothetical protein